MRVYQQLNLKNKVKNKVSEQAEQKQTHRNRERFDSCQMGEGLRGMGVKGERIKKYKLVVTD